MNQTSDKRGRNQSTSGVASEAAEASVSPFFYKTSVPNPSALQMPKHLRSPFSSPIFATAQSTFGGINSVANDDSSESDRSESEASKSTKEKMKEAKKKPARVSIGVMPMEGNLLDGSIASSGSESEDEPVKKKKQKTNTGSQEEDEEEDNKEEDLMEEMDKAKDKGLSGNENDDDWTAVWEEATTVTPMLFGEEEVENPHQESLRKLKKWTKELLATKKKLEDARLENALLLNKIYEVGGNRDQCD